MSEENLDDDEVRLFRILWLEIEKSLTAVAMELVTASLIGVRYSIARQKLSAMRIFDSIAIDMCERSCVLYDGDYATLVACPKCGQARWKDERRTAYKQFHYLPFLPRLAVQMQNHKRRKELDYSFHYINNHVPEGAAYSAPTDGVLKDIFDGETFKQMVGDGSLSLHRRSLFLGISLDGFRVFRT